jgi:hypothetical protein
MNDAFFVIKQVLTRGWKQVEKGILKSYHGHLDDVGQTHRLEVILREVVLHANVVDIPTDDEPEVAPEPELMHFTDADWYSFCIVDLSFTDMLA